MKGVDKNMESYDIEGIRGQFPALSLEVNGRPAAYFDGPGGTQVPAAVIEAQKKYFTSQNSNRGGAFDTSRETDRVIAEGRGHVAALLGARPQEIAFGANMTTLTFRLSRALARDLQPGDEILITDLDHEANRDPWLALKQQGVAVKSVRFNPEDCTLDMEDFISKLSSKTKIAAVAYASNAVGIINDLRKIRALTRQADALLVVDAVHYVPHRAVDVGDLECDYLLCSAYKFFGPHVGVLYGRSEAFEQLKTYRVRPQKEQMPYKMETGTANHEGIAGTTEAVKFIASLAGGKNGHDLRAAVLSGMEGLEEYESELMQSLIEGLKDIPSVRLYGPTGAAAPCTPTAAFTKEGATPRELATRLGDIGIFVWDGDFYATTLIEKLGLADSGGVVRVGLAPYNTQEEVDRLLEAIEQA